jgi:ABC-type multidrug transport system fused ATPase/permease subunit
MVFEFLASLSWREMLLAVVVLLAIYVLFAFLRIGRLRREARVAQELSPGAAQNAIQSYSAVRESGREAEAAPADAAGQTSLAELSATMKEQMSAWNERHSRTLELRRKVDVLEQDLAQLRREIGGLRAEVQTLREEQRREISKVKITQSASPFYSDAMQLATQGREAADISVLCGISRAEAELVVALARNDSQAFD